MTAQPIDTPAGAMWSPDPIRQRKANYTIEDAIALPDDAPRVELRDGVIVVVPSPAFGHQKIGNRLYRWFEDHAPSVYEPATAIGVVVSLGDTFEPDVLLLQENAVDRAKHYFNAEDVVLAVEIVSPSTRRRDRLEKPPQYAAAGIRHFWRIEQDPVHVFAYELIDDGYKLVADATDELVLDSPFEIRLPIREITP